jgi:hypothetical protein
MVVLMSVVSQFSINVAALGAKSVVHINDVLSIWTWAFWSAPCNQEKLLVGHTARVACTVQGRLAQARYNVGVSIVFYIAEMVLFS